MPRSAGAAREPSVWIGTSGYAYPHWRELFYPPDLAEDGWLPYYAERLCSVEINATFYGLPAPETVEAWRAAAPSGFVFALKLSRYGTHLKHLKDPERWLPVFLERAVRLGQKLGPILVQLPPRWRCDPARLARFLEAAPHDQRFAVELRDPSWLCGPVYDLLREHGAALCIHDLLPDHPDVVTAGWTYRRFHGPQGERYAGSYTPQALTAVAGWTRRHLDEGRDVYAYFNNDAAGHAVRNARDLRGYVEEARAGSARGTTSP